MNAKLWASALVLLALLVYPVVRVVGAAPDRPETDEKPRNEVPFAQHGPVCRAPVGAASRATLEAKLERIRRQLAADPDRARAEDIVVLNNQGYNYRSLTSPEESALLELERRLQQ